MLHLLRAFLEYQPPISLRHAKVFKRSTQRRKGAR